jgi:peptide/nickel transport system ATP-binding protein
MPLLEVTNLAFSTSSGPTFSKELKSILYDVSFNLEEGLTLGLIGESGSGKSTIARCIAGLSAPSSGTMMFSGINVFPEIQNRKNIGTSIQMFFQNHSASLDPRIKIRESLFEGIKNCDRCSAERISRELLSLVELPDDILERYPSELSGGQRQRIALARVLSISPKLLILDEPTSSLDVITQIQMLKMIKDIQRKTHTAILYISHDVLTASLICDRIAVLYNGTIVEVEDTRKLLMDPQHPYTRETVLYTIQRQ